MTTITGRTAITLAETFGVALHKHSDPTEGARFAISPGYAREIANQDSSLVWCAAEDVAALVTDAAIRTLRTEAVAGGDYHQSDLCDRALAADTVDQDGNEIALADMTQEQARVECALAIAAAKAARS
jgi:hypothetical protein